MKKISARLEKIDIPILAAGSILCLIFILYVAIRPKSAEKMMSLINGIICQRFGWFYLLAVSIFLAFLLWLALSRYGKITLGKDGEKPDYKASSWFFMLFAAGMGIGLVFWSVAEPMSHYLAPLLGTERTPEAAKEAMRVTFTHWGLHPWAAFGVVGLPLAYFQFRLDKPMLISSCLSPFLGETPEKTFFGRLVNTLAIFATVFGVATSLGLGAMQINSGLKYAFGIPASDTVAVIIILVVTAIFIASAVSGIQRGILFLSHLNMIFAGALIAMVFTLGPTTFLLKFFTERLGAYLGDLVPTSFWTDAFEESDGWLDSWTVFYWAWWISWSPFVGGFIARISKGRTIGEFVVGTLIFPTILSFVFITVLGGTALHFDLSGLTDIADAVNENTSFALFALLDELPASLFFSLIAIFLIAIFFITSADSSTYVCAIQTSRGVKNPPPVLLVFWGLSECLIAIFLLMVGGLSTLQSAAIIAAFPFMIVCLFLILALLKALRREDCNQEERLPGKR